MDTLTGRLGPREIALAAAFGLLLGLVPKLNLLFAVLAILFFLSHANIVIGLVLAIVVSFLTPWTYPTAHRLGAEILQNPQVQQWGGQLYQIPVIPWLMLDNTVVLGSFLLGLVLFFPVFFVFWIPLKAIWPRKEEPQTES